MPVEPIFADVQAQKEGWNG